MYADSDFSWTNIVFWAVPYSQSQLEMCVLWLWTHDISLRSSRLMWREIPLRFCVCCSLMFALWLLATLFMLVGWSPPLLFVVGLLERFAIATVHRVFVGALWWRWRWKQFDCFHKFLVIFAQILYYWSILAPLLSHNLAALLCIVSTEGSKLECWIN